MRILVAVKAVADFGMLAEKDWTPGEAWRVDVSFAKSVLNCFDESAAELALTLCEAQLTALTVGGSQADFYLKQLLALGYQDVVRIAAPEWVDLRFNPQAIARLIAGYHRHVTPQDVLLLGEQSPEGHNMQTAFLLAEHLGWPCLSGVTGIEDAGDGVLRVTRLAAGRIQHVTVRPPLVLAVGNAAGAGVLRVPTLKQKLAAGQKSITACTPEMLQLSWDTLAGEGAAQLRHLARRRSQRAGIRIEGADAQEKARRLYHEHLKERLGR